jgi:hypothetical protein
LLAGLCLGGALMVTGCKQAENDRCEVDNDCETGLTCVRSAMRDDGVCKSMGDAGVVVAPPLPDAGPDTLADGSPADAAVDGAIEAGTDGTVGGDGARDVPVTSDGPAATDVSGDIAVPALDASSN